jgi:hypothetical protein
VGGLRKLPEDTIGFGNIDDRFLLNSAMKIAKDILTFEQSVWLWCRSLVFGSADIL